LYKALDTIKPDALLIQLRPDVLLKNFETSNLRTFLNKNKEYVLDE
jgi:hypothetical protein